MGSGLFCTLDERGNVSLGAHALGVAGVVPGVNGGCDNAAPVVLFVLCLCGLDLVGQQMVGVGGGGRCALVHACMHACAHVGYRPNDAPCKDRILQPHGISSA